METETSKRWDKLTEISKKRKIEAAARLKEYKKRYMTAYRKGEEYSIKSDDTFASTEAPYKIEKAKKECIQKLLEVKDLMIKLKNLIDKVKDRKVYEGPTLDYIIADLANTIEDIYKLKPLKDNSEEDFL